MPCVASTHWGDRVGKEGSSFSIVYCFKQSSPGVGLVFKHISLESDLTPWLSAVLVRECSPPLWLQIFKCAEKKQIDRIMWGESAKMTMAWQLGGSIGSILVPI